MPVSLGAFIPSCPSAAAAHRGKNCGVGDRRRGGGEGNLQNS